MVKKSEAIRMICFDSGFATSMLQEENATIKNRRIKHLRPIIDLRIVQIYKSHELESFNFPIFAVNLKITK